MALVPRVANTGRRLVAVARNSIVTGPPSRSLKTGELAKKISHFSETEYTKHLPKASYGGIHTVTLLPGQGIGPELSQHVKQIFSTTGVPVVFEEIQIDPHTRDEQHLEEAIISCRRNGAALKGNIETRSLDPKIISRNVTLRKELDLFVSVFHCTSYPGVECRRGDIDIIIVRQNTDGEYAMREHEAIPGVVECLKVMTLKNAKRLARFAFEHARRKGRKKVTIIHKANIMKVSDGMFLEVARETAKRYPDIECNDMIIDNCCMQLVSNPDQFDVMLTTNLYGAIVTNLICGLTNGQGLLSGQDFGEEVAIFETATRNTGTDMVGKNIANPIAFMNAAADLLHYLDLERHSKRLKHAIHQTINVDKIHTADIGGCASSTDVVQHLLNHMISTMQKYDYH